jgi:rod shape-determining protein MreC
MLAFVRKNQILLSSFLSVLLSLYIIAAASNGQLRDPIGQILLQLIRPLQSGAQEIVLEVKGVYQSVIALKSLSQENQRLKGKILELETERDRLLEAEATNRTLRGLLDLKAQLAVGSTTAAVIGHSASTWFQSITLDKGSRDGIQKGMAVVSPQGVVGQIVAAASRSAKVLVVTDPHSAVDVVVQRSRARGIVSGSLNNGAVMKYVKRSEDVREGDRLITSGLDGVYPKGLFVGTVVKVNKMGYGLFQQVSVSLAVDPSRVEEVLVLAASGNERVN